MKCRAVIFLALVAIVSLATAVTAAVNLEWRPADQRVHVGDTVSIGLYAVSDSGSDWPISAMDVIIQNDAAYLKFTGITGDGAPYPWLYSGFRSDAPDNLNKKLYDGDVMYSAWAQLGQTAAATPQGLLVTTFQFVSQSPVSSTSVSVHRTYAISAETCVFDGTVPNLDVTGQLGSARVTIAPAGALTSVAEAKALPDGSTAEIWGVPVTRTYETYFYIEDSDRTAGIRVNCLPGQLPALGTAPTVRGTIVTTLGERVLNNVTVTPGAEVPFPKPLAMNCESLRSGLNPQGLIVRISGKAHVDVPGSPAFILQDGSHQGINVELHDVAAPLDGQYVVVTGVLGADSSGPLLRVSNHDPIQIMQ